MQTRERTTRGVGRLLRDTAGCFVLFIFMDLGQRVSTLIRPGGANLSRRGRGKRLFVVLAAVPVPRLTHYPFKDVSTRGDERSAPLADKIEEERERDFTYKVVDSINAADLP